MSDEGDFSERDQVTLEELRKLWGSRSQNELGTCWKIGKKLQSCVGAYYERLRPGSLQFLKKVSKELGVSVAELNRMRVFAFNCQDAARVPKQFPEVTSWATFKKTFPSLNPVEGNKARMTKEEILEAFQDARKNLEKVAKALEALGTCPDKRVRRSLVKALRDVLQSASGCLEITFSLDEK